MLRRKLQPKIQGKQRAVCAKCYLLFLPHGSVDDVVDWLRKNDPNPDALDEPTLGGLSNLTDVPLPKKMTPTEKKKFVDDSVDWLRKNNPDLTKIDGPTLDTALTPLI